ncbi:hypothetical protein DDR33_09955 [Pararcticibacter amylolyticus]|uniref:Beta-lactamase class A catalytic domain-containing protein n=2 Tax=Pararcticibacter amylolyticus TaxID=2173175 RepID=A0A2U2PHA0_9SPHI|nr:hypothetical protein DDR33_09955 [Pararcticibacter amylolyticus]
MRSVGVLIVLCMISMISSAQKTDKWFGSLLLKEGSPAFKKVLDAPSVYQYQVIYTRIDRDRNNKPHFKSFYLNTDAGRYFNPASTVKLPAALIALEKLNDLKITGVDKYSPMITDSVFSGQTKVLKDETSENGYPSVAHYIKKVFLVSDNDAYNRLYEWDGQQDLNEKLWQKGYVNTRINRRFVPLSEEENRHTNPVSFLKEGKTVYTQAPAYSKVTFDFSRKVLIGKAHYNRSDVLVNEPMDFSRHNNFPLEEQQAMLRAILFPEAVKRKQTFRLSSDDYHFLYQYMSMLPRESRYPRYDTTEFFDGYAKFFLGRDGKSVLPSAVRIFSKAGWAYGFMTDNAYVADMENNIEFLISATIYVNSDGILNDDKYDYDTIGYPFFKELGEIIYKNELNRKKRYKPDFSKFR